MYKLPEQLTTSSRAAGMSWNDEFADMPTPFRAQNFDLLQRACTREAIVRAVVLLNATSEHASSAAWLESRALEWLPRFEAPPRTHLAGLFLIELMSAPVSIRQVEGPDGRPSLTINDPAVVVEEVLRQREAVATEWAAELRGTPATHAALLREILEEQLGQE